MDVKPLLIKLAGGSGGQSHICSGLPKETDVPEVFEPLFGFLHCWIAAAFFHWNFGISISNRCKPRS